MAKKNVLIDPAHFLIGDTVKFSYQGQDVTGTILKKGSTSAQVICDDQREFRVPYHRLVKLSNALPHPVRLVHEHRRAAFTPGDRVRFPFRGTALQGVLVRVNPTRGHVAADDGKEYRVPYSLLQRVEETPPAATVLRNPTELETVAQVARALLSKHQLPQWSFQFDNGAKRAGCCHYATQVISHSYEFAKRAPDEEITDTLLHEIAHAVVGREHHHDAVWRAKALEIGCSGRRCHDLQFTPPRYIVQCARGCWRGIAERRTRGVVCKRCRGQVLYETYSEEHWRSVTARALEETTQDVSHDAKIP
jgi:predicted SprT family Zn-dependent metalloprotease/sporulation protein YlmC with PRC-barrel domain